MRKTTSERISVADSATETCKCRPTADSNQDHRSKPVAIDSSSSVCPGIAIFLILIFLIFVVLLVLLLLFLLLLFLGQARSWDMPFKILGTCPLLGQALQNV